MNNKCCCNKNVLNTSTSVSTEVITSAPINFLQNEVKSGCDIKHAEGTPVITIKTPGIYLINFTAIGYATGGTGVVTVNLQNNGINVPSAEATVDASAAAIQGTFTFSKVIKVRPSCCNVDNTANLTFINSGVPATFASANVSVIKL